MAESNKKRSGSRIAHRRRNSGVGREDKGDSVYLLWHIDAEGDEKLIGAYEKHSKASAAIERLKNKPGFKEQGGAFEIVAYELNKDHWTDGFAQHEGFSLPAWFRPS